MIKKINAIKNFNENTTNRQQSFISLSFKTRFHLSNKINKLINQFNSIQSHNR